MTQRIEAPSLKAMLRDGQELALLDVREEGRFAAAHLLYAVPLPLSRLELRIRALVPRRGTRVVLMDGGEAQDALATRAAERLASFGYTDVRVLTGGAEGWQAAGYELFSGLNVPSKAFGEFVEHAYETPSVAPEELHALIASGRPMVILDSRPMDEYSVMNIPGGVNVPGAELVYRVAEMAPDPETLVVVNCAGRTRSIIGAQSLINAGIPNPVVALRNGTMGWHLAGFPLERGNRHTAPTPAQQTLAQAQAAAARVAARFGVRTVDATTLAAWQGEAEARSLYVLDVRIAEEFAAGHRPGTHNAPGGQLVQATDTYIGTRNARVVLLDDGSAVRATMTASWLIQMGWQEVYVLSGGVGGGPLETGPAPLDVPGLFRVEVPLISAAELAQRLAAPEPPTVFDLARSPQYRRGHIPGAWFAIRAELGQALKRAGSPRSVVLTAPEEALARLAVADARAAGAAEVVALAGGTGAWQAAGHPLAQDTERMANDPLDVFPKPYERPDAIEDAMRAYLTWEVALVEQIERDGDANFKPYP